MCGVHVYMLGTGRTVHYKCYHTDIFVEYAINI